MFSVNITTTFCTMLYLNILMRLPELSTKICKETALQFDLSVSFPVNFLIFRIFATQAIKHIKISRCVEFLKKENSNVLF